ncbi:MAG: TRAP transporter large permease [Dorea sp.]|jgi:C4-dicarboxylate transporter DctM subunit|nr:TRAP transporter large permease [Dorea sp.]
MHILILVFFIIFLALGIPVAVSMGLTSFLYLFLFMDVSPMVVVQQMISGVNKFTLLAIPFFMLSGAYMEHGGISKRIVRFCNSLFGSLPGGLAIVMVVASVIFAAMTGSGVATCAAVGGIMFPIMKQEGYDEDFYCGLQSVAGILGPLIPPSILLVLYGVAVNISVSDLLMGGLVPGLFLGFLYIVLTVFICKTKKIGNQGTKFSVKEVGESFLHAIGALLVPGIILGGIYSGFCTATEAAALAALYSLIVGVFFYKEMTIKEAVKITLEQMKQMGGLTIIVAAANAFAWVMTREQIPQKIAGALISVSSSKLVFMALVALLVLFVGCFMDATPSVLLLAPILAPVATEYGVDPIHFAIFLVTGVLIGLATPPVGANLFAVSSMTGRPLQKFVPYVLPYLAVTVIGLIIIGVFPAFSTWLPNMVK